MQTLLNFNHIIQKNWLQRNFKAKYQILNAIDLNESHQDMLKKYELSEKDHYFLNDYCLSKKIDFLSTPYDVINAVLLNKINVKMFKIASADIVDYQLHRFISKTSKPVIILRDVLLTILKKL